MSNTLILGIGNTLLADEGVGVHALNQLRTTSLPKDVELLDGGTLSFTLAGPLAETDKLVVIDAARLNRPAGTVKTFVDTEMDNFLVSHTCSTVHEVSLRDLMDIAHLSGEIPKRRALIAVQPQNIEIGEELSPELSSAIPKICAEVRSLLERWA